MYVTGAPCRGVTVPRSLPSCAGGVPPREVQAGAGSPGPGGGRGEAAQRHGLGGAENGSCGETKLLLRTLWKYDY